MSDLAARYDGAALGPDEATLISALRNQDDIPILMDVVVEQVNIGVSQEAHFARSFDGSGKQNLVDFESVEVEREEIESVAPPFSRELISKTISDVLEKRLPELVAEVMQALNSAESPNKND